MSARRGSVGTFAVVLLGTAGLATAGTPGPSRSAAERGRDVLTVKRFLRGSIWTASAYTGAGKLWDGTAPDPFRDPESYAAAFNRRYGLHPAPYPNDGLPMGLKRGAKPDGTRAGLQIDCLVCHGGSIGGTSYVGLGNTQLDLSRMFDELMKAEGRRMPPSTFVINSVRGTVNAGMFSAVLLSLRNADLSTRLFPLPLGANLPEMDTPAWWNLRKKKTIYYDGRTPAASVRSSMQFLLGEKSLDDLKALEPDFDDLFAFLRSLTPPKYPFPVDRAKADRGQTVFEDTCSRCHGTYGEGGEYPNRVVPLKEIGTDPARALGLSDRLVAHYNRTWLAENHPAKTKLVGYQAPPLDGVWATAPYLHNGSVPTLFHLLKSSARPARYTRPPSTEFAHYDREKVGWKFEEVESSRALGAEERRSVFDASRFGLGNGGHTFGDKLSDAERGDLVEYLKTL
jgi:hypothetical protein